MELAGFLESVFSGLAAHWYHPPHWEVPCEVREEVRIKGYCGDTVGLRH